VLAPGPGSERAAAQRALRVRDQTIGIDLLARPDAAALGAGAVRVVEREHPRRDLGQRDAALGARETLGEDERRAGAVGILDLGPAVGEAQRGLERVRHAGAGGVADDEPVDHHLDRVLLVLVEVDLAGELADRAVHARTGEALATEIEEELLVLALASPDDR